MDAADENTDARLVLDTEKATGDYLMGDSGSEATVTVKGVAHSVEASDSAGRKGFTYGMNG